MNPYDLLQRQGIGVKGNRAMQYFGGKADVGKRIAKICMGRLTAGSTFVDMFCGSLNVIRHVPRQTELAAGGLVDVRRVAIDACEPLITMWKAAMAGWVPPKVVTREEYRRTMETENPQDPLTAFILFGCSFGGKWRGGYAKDRPEQRYAECARNGVVKKARDCDGVELECASYLSKRPGCWSSGTVLYCDPPYYATTGYAALERFDSDLFWCWAEEHAHRGVHVYVSEGTLCEQRLGWSLELEQIASQGGRLTPGVKAPRIDRLFYMGPSASRYKG